MSKSKLYSVFDVKASAFSPPMCFQTTGLAIRSFQDECSRSDSLIARHPEDYDLRQVGEFDLATGQLTALTVPVPVIKASDIVNGGSNVERAA